MSTMKRMSVTDKQHPLFGIAKKEMGSTKTLPTSFLVINYFA